MQVIWKRLYNQGSSQDKGTIYQLRNVINRTNVPTDPQNNMNAAEDFMLLILHAHVVAAAEAIQSINPSNKVMQLAEAIVTNFVRLPRIGGEEAEVCDDKVYVYAIELLSLGIIWHGYHDSVREGDGDRILRFWKLLLVIFKSSNNYNYAKEAVNLLLQYHYIFSERQKAQLLWSCCINTRGHPGTNIPCDLFMEHLNRRLKMVVHFLRANVTPKAIQKAGRAIAPVQQVCQVFEQQTAPYLHSHHHSVPSFGKDFDTVLKVLREEEVFMPIRIRQHSTFKFNCTLIEKHSALDLNKTVEKSIKQLYFH